MSWVRGLYLGSDRRHQDRVDTAELHVDLEAEVGECLRAGLVDVLGLDALGGHTQHCVAHSLHLGVHRRLARQHHHHQLK